MRDWPTAYIQGLSQNGPPPGANDIVELKVDSILRVPNLLRLREIDTSPRNVRRLVFLLGEIHPYDGALQGLYDYVPEGNQNDRDDDNGTWIIVNDGRSAWIKMS